MPNKIGGESSGGRSNSPVSSDSDSEEAGAVGGAAGGGGSSQGVRLRGGQRVSVSSTHPQPPAAPPSKFRDKLRALVESAGKSLDPMGVSAVLEGALKDVQAMKDLKPEVKEALITEVRHQQASLAANKSPKPSSSHHHGASDSE